ncbi:MAG: hypothetical protein IIU20_01500, partial [Bacteroidales bacterium]|nr:hypothetical protein [Bacteroidales bacterium]
MTALLFFAAVPFGSAYRASDDQGQSSEDHGQAFTDITGLMKLFGERDNVSFMKVGRVAMSMGKTFGKAAISDPWVRMVIKAFRRVSGVFILDYGECLESTKELIEDEIGKHL